MPSLIDKHGNVAFFGRVSWGNFVDWLVTLCLGGIIMLTTVFLGGARPDTHLTLLPLYALLLGLHGLWLAVETDSPKRLSQVPLWFVPGLFWMWCSLLWVSPVPWRGWYEMIYAMEIFIVLWVLLNNVRSRAHLWCLIGMSILPSAVSVLNGFYQFFQNPESMSGALTNYPLELRSEFLGRATGSFADPNSFAAFLLMLLPSLLIAASVTRLPKVLRVLAFYIALMFLAGIAFTQSYWATALAVVLLAVVPWFCFKRIKRRVAISVIGVLAAALIFLSMISFHPLFQKGLERALSTEGEGVRLVLWREALVMAVEHPIAGVGAGAYGSTFQQSPRTLLSDAPVTPHNDYLLILSQLGLVGAFLFGAPMLFVFWRAWRRWRAEPFAVKLRESKGSIMPPQRFFLSLGLSGAIAFALCMGLTFIFYVPALALYGVLVFSILVKTSFNSGLRLPERWPFRVGYALFAICVGWLFYVNSAPRLEAQALELRARQELDNVVEMRVHISGNTALLEKVIGLYEDAVRATPTNADAWIGLSAAVCQLYFRNPADFESIAARAVASAERGLELSPRFWKAWAQVGVAQSFNGQPEAAEQALRKALELAPNSSNAHYYWASFLSADGSRRDEALVTVRRALEINPRNAAARRLEQKLLIL